MRRAYISRLSFLLLAPLSGSLAGCPMDDPQEEGGTLTPTEEDSTGMGPDETGGSAYAVSGMITRSAELPEDGDGIGTLVVAAFAECDLAMPVVLGAQIIPNADLSTEDAQVEFSIERLAGGTVYLVSFLDDDGNLDPENPLPDEGDPVMAEVAGDGVLTCIEVEMEDSDVTGVMVDLNELAMPVG